MKYKTIQLSHTEEIMQKYGVNSLMAKVIESKKLDQKTVNIIIHDKDENFKVDYNNEEYSYRT